MLLPPPPPPPLLLPPSIVEGIGALSPPSASPLPPEASAVSLCFLFLAEEEGAAAAAEVASAPCEEGAPPFKGEADAVEAEAPAEEDEEESSEDWGGVGEDRTFLLGLRDRFWGRDAGGVMSAPLPPPPHPSSLDASRTPDGDCPH